MKHAIKISLYFGLRMLAICVFALPAYSANEKPKEILIFGDSLSAAYGIQVEQGWVNLLANKLNEQGLPYKITNESIGGETTDGGLRRLPAILDRTNPDIIVLELGANDGLRGFPIKIIKRNLNQLVEMAKQRNISLLLLGIHIPPNYGKVYTEKFHAVFGQVALQQEVPMVPFFLDGVATDNTLMQNDGLHPNAKGQPILLDNVWKELVKLLNTES